MVRYETRRDDPRLIEYKLCCCCANPISNLDVGPPDGCQAPNYHNTLYDIERKKGQFNIEQGETEVLSAKKERERERKQAMRRKRKLQLNITLP
ncbi:hypothetical protein ACE6H2_003620 [Prunus campanulata]